ncbi:hypothetical protein OG594_09045 [Streptomyces sp. NBC_01214]|uniref:hypothetical protein n=1 Tax=Streptomyces sp. NBC_01214 TaxID=2903777 RepID=UPI0022526FFA|nr:hypothetical protein [Streptomyces sp. NBC_01214]MCX4801796.1 hypothetical protein [Streptomyces sp. NBC_01214]
MKLFNREPALWLGLVAIGVKLLAAFGMDVSAEQQAVINAVAAALVGLILAVVAGDAIGAAVLGFAQAALALAVGFGLDWSAEQQAVVLAAAAAVVAMWDRTQITAPAPVAAAPRPLSGV